MSKLWEESKSSRRLIVYTDSYLDHPDLAKTAYGILRFSAANVVAVWDNKHAGRRVCDIAPGLQDCAIPIIADPMVDSHLYDMVVGFNPFGGMLTPHQRGDLERAISRGARIINGTHDLLPYGESVVNLRDPSRGSHTVADGTPSGRLRILTVGTSHAIGKLTNTILLQRYAEKAGLHATWLPTGQTGVIIARRGRVIDSIPIDFVPGAVETLLAEHAVGSDVIVVEGQGSIFHPSYSPTTVALLHASAPQYLHLCHRLGQDRMWGFDAPIPSASAAIVAHSDLARSLGLKINWLGLSLDSSRVSEEEYRATASDLEEELGLPVRDPLRDSAEIFVERLKTELLDA